MLNWRSDVDASLPKGAVAFPERESVVSRKFGQSTEIFCGQERRHFFKVIRGSVRIVRFMANGRRQVTAFWLPGDLFGLEAGSTNSCSAEAIEDSEILIMNRSSPGELAATPEAVMQLWQEAIMQLHHANDHLLLLGQKNAEERVGTFLLEMHDRLSQGSHIDLPMGRQDIADYLGLTVETVSRTLTHFELMGLISISSSRRIAINDREALLDLSEGLCERRRHPRMSRRRRESASVTHSAA